MSPLCIWSGRGPVDKYRQVRGAERKWQPHHRGQCRNQDLSWAVDAKRSRTTPTSSVLGEPSPRHVAASPQASRHLVDPYLQAHEASNTAGIPNQPFPKSVHPLPLAGWCWPPALAWLTDIWKKQRPRVFKEGLPISSSEKPLPRSWPHRKVPCVRGSWNDPELRARWGQGCSSGCSLRHRARTSVWAEFPFCE